MWDMRDVKNTSAPAVKSGEWEVSEVLRVRYRSMLGGHLHMRGVLSCFANTPSDNCAASLCSVDGHSLDTFLPVTLIFYPYGTVRTRLCKMRIVLDTLR